MFLLPTKTMISANHCFHCFSWPVWAVALGRYRVAPLVSDIRTWVDRIDEVPSQQNKSTFMTLYVLVTFGHQSRGHGPVPRLSPRLSRKPEWKRNASTLCLCKQSVLMQSMVWALTNNWYSKSWEQDFVFSWLFFNRLESKIVPIRAELASSQ